MWNPVSLVAKHNNIPEADLVDFAISRDTKYTIVVERGVAIVSIWHVEDLLEDFKEFQAEADINEVEYLLEQHPEFVNLDVGCEFDPKHVGV
jgi:hypothetical protein